MTANERPGSGAEQAAKPAVGAIVTGLLVVGLGYLAASAQGMAAAPSSAAATVALAIMVAGAALALCGLASLRWKALRRPARLAHYLVLTLLAAAFVVDRLIGALA